MCFVPMYNKGETLALMPEETSFYVDKKFTS